MDPASPLGGAAARPGTADAPGEAKDIDSATPSVTTDQFVVVSNRVRQIVLR